VLKGYLRQAIPPEAVFQALRGVAQAQAVPQLHCVPQPQPLLAAVAWQPQAQPVPGQFWQLQSDSMRSFMVVLLVRWL
jgi:hypothetical protein